MICSKKNYWIYSPIIWFFSKRTRPLVDTKKAGHEFYICFFSLVLASYLYEENNMKKQLQLWCFSREKIDEKQ
jgi:hypothetical protein